MLRSSVLLVFSLLACFAASAQPEEQVLSDKFRITGGFGGPFFVGSWAENHAGVGAGGGGGIVAGRFFLGGFGQGETFGRHDFDGREYELGIGYGGLWLGYSYPTRKVVHGFAQAKIGWGAVTRSEPGEGDNDDSLEDDIFTMTPEIGAEINVTHWFRLVAHGGWRFVTGVNRTPRFTSADFSKPVYGLTLRFGKF